MMASLSAYDFCALWIQISRIFPISGASYIQNPLNFAKVNQMLVVSWFTVCGNFNLDFIGLWVSRVCQESSCPKCRLFFPAHCPEFVQKSGCPKCLPKLSCSLSGVGPGPRRGGTQACLLNICTPATGSSCDMLVKQE